MTVVHFAREGCNGVRKTKPRRREHVVAPYDFARKGTVARTQRGERPERIETDRARKVSSKRGAQTRDR